MSTWGRIAEIIWIIAKLAPLYSFPVAWMFKWKNKRGRLLLGLGLSIICFILFGALSLLISFGKDGMIPTR